MGSLARKIQRNAARLDRTTKTNQHRLYADRELFLRRQHNIHMDREIERKLLEEKQKQELLDLADPKLKGVKGGNCNRSACQQPFAIFYNHGTRLYYCAKCAHDLNFDKFNHADAKNTYGHLLVQVDQDAYEDLRAKSLLPGGQIRPIERALRMAEHLVERGEIFHN